MPPTPETGLERAEIPIEQLGEMAPATGHIAPVLPMPITLPSLPTPVTDDASSQPNGGVPLVASDEDLIEKEWVDKAKKIITETKDDPHRREQEVGKLQIDYLKKRYGKDLGVTE